MTGWGILFLSLPFVGFLALQSEFVTELELSGEVAGGRGVIEHVVDTTHSEEHRALLEVRFRYTVEGATYRATSYAAGRYRPVGAAVAVEYAVHDPSVARVRGLRGRPFPHAAALLLLLPLVGIVVVALGLQQGRAALKLMRGGEVAHARLVNKRPTSATVDGRTVYELMFELELTEEQLARATSPNRWRRWSRKHRFAHRTHRPAEVMDGNFEEVLYDPKHPGRALPLDALPAGVKRREEGFWAPWWTDLLLVLPLVFAGTLMAMIALA